MRYASQADLVNVPRLVYRRCYQWPEPRTEEFDLLIAEVPLEIRVDGIGNQFLELMGWKIVEDEICGHSDRMGYSIPDSHESCERVSLYKTDMFYFYYKNIVIDSNGLSLTQFRDKVTPYINLAYTEAALDKLGE
jgi:hypothetical protein